MSRAGAPAVGAPPAGGRSAAVAGLRRRVGRWATVLVAVLALAVGASVAGLLPVQIVRISSASMAPTIGDGDLVLVERGAGPVGRRDVVAAVHPNTGEQLIKRVVGIGGDRVAIRDGVLVVNGAEVCEPSIDPEGMDGAWSGTVTVPSGSVFLMGDERDFSFDSRDFGPVALADVVGLVRVRVWPVPGPLTEDRC